MKRRWVKLQSNGEGDDNDDSESEDGSMFIEETDTEVREKIEKQRLERTCRVSTLLLIATMRLMSLRCGR